MQPSPAGLKLAKFSEETTAILKKALPATANINNPVDVIGDASSDRYLAAIQAAFDDPDVAGVFVILTPQSMTDIDTIAGMSPRLLKDRPSPFMPLLWVKRMWPRVLTFFRRHKIPHYILPESMCDSYQAVYHFNKNVKPKVHQLARPG